MKYSITHKDKHPLLLVQIDVIPIPQLAIIDTGCASNFIKVHPNYINSPLFNRTGRVIRSYTANGQPNDSPEIRQTVTIGEYSFDLLIGIGDFNMAGATVILGAKFLYDNKLSLYINGDYFVIKKEDSNDIILAESTP